MFQDEAGLATERFIHKHPLGMDDTNVPGFYRNIARFFNLHIQKKIGFTGFIVVPHMVHTLPYFLEALTSIGPILAIIPKSSRYVPEIEESLDEIYKPYIRRDINKTVLNTDPITTYLFLRAIANRYPHYRIMILDHGGYFAPCLDILHEFNREYNGRLAGIVEHTWNGHLRYAEALQDLPLTIPIYSIARSHLKSYEDSHVAASIINALVTKILGGEGLNQDVSRLKIGIVGYGHMGEAIARELFNRTTQENIVICDNNEDRLTKAR